MSPPYCHTSKSSHLLSSPRTSIRKTAVEFPEEAEEDEARHEAIEEEEEEEDPDFPNTLDAMTQRATLDEKFWTCPGAVNFNVRGPNYLKVSLHPQSQRCNHNASFTCAEASISQWTVPAVVPS